MVCTMMQVVIHERDPHWEEARKLTTGAEQASKVSAAKVTPPLTPAACDHRFDLSELQQ